MEPILRVSGLTKTFSRQGQADFTAVKNISFGLFPGRVSRHHRGERAAEKPLPST